ncbi:MAG: hypothetical protein ABI688_02525 [Bacteroidota bacterium]
MSYQIYDTGTSIRFVRDGKESFVIKNTVTKISVIRENVIKIGTGSCLSSIYIRYQEVSIPFTFSVLELVNYLNTWITNANNSPEGPSE